MSDQDIRAFYHAFSSVQICHSELVEYMDDYVNQSIKLGKSRRSLIKFKASPNNNSLVVERT